MPLPVLKACGTVADGVTVPHLLNVLTAHHDVDDSEFPLKVLFQISPLVIASNMCHFQKSR